ncbi:MAG TPA: alpha/beta hydrolase [Hyphomicrobiaceae bacterium]|nr:alpha/beta hydrolase [Hyphomicrobiaceae bacterium]
MMPDEMVDAPLPQDPDAWGEIAFQRFCTPATSRYRSADHDVLVERARFHLANASAVRVRMAEGDLQAYVFDPVGAWNGASVLLVHGWTGEASFMTAFAEHLRKRGFRIVLFDFPAHGRSSPERASLIDCAHAVREVAEALGPIEYVLAHSLGGMAALLAGGGGAPMPRGYPFRAFVLVAMPNHFSTVTRTFGEDEGLSPEAQRAYERRLETIARRKIADFTGVNLLKKTGRPALLLHSRDDPDIIFAEAKEIAAANASAALIAFDDLGHRKILYAPPAVRAAGAFLSRQHHATVARPGA